MPDMLRNLSIAGVHPRAWTRWPTTGTPGLGIVTGGTLDVFRDGADGPSLSPAAGPVAACLLEAYATQHGYALYVEQDLQRWGLDRPWVAAGTNLLSWAKFPLMGALLRSQPTLPILVWVDMDVLLLNASVSLLMRLTTMPDCSAGLLGAWDRETLWYLPPWRKNDFNSTRWRQQRWASQLASTGESSYFWFGRDVNANYKLNVNSGFFALRNVPLAHDLLELAWAAGNDPEHYKQHDPGWRGKAPGSAYFGWPGEQGGLWDALTNSSRYLRRLCVATPGWLQLLVTRPVLRWNGTGFGPANLERAIRSQSNGSNFAMHMVGMNRTMRARGLGIGARLFGAQHCAA